MAASDPTTPPRPQLSLCVGVTGPRGAGAASVEAGVLATVTGLLGELAALTAAVHAAHGRCFQDASPRLVLLSALAPGAEQAAAGAARALGYRLRAVLPLAAGPYRQALPAKARAGFDALFDGAQVWSAPPIPGPPGLTHGAASEALVAQSDVVIALAGQAGGPGGGAGEVIEYAVRRGTPVVSLPAETGGAAWILWAGFDGLAPDRLDRESVPRRPLSAAALEVVVKTVLAPPAEPAEQAAVNRYFAERAPGWKWRMEYPFLLAVTGVRVARQDRADWSHRGFRTPELPGADANPDGAALLNEAFGWADGLADYAAHDYRSGLIFNYLAAAAAVLLALSELVWPHAKVWLVLAELVMIGLLITNTALGARHQWHRRWLDYRYLAEQLRPLRTLKALGAATPARQVAGGFGASGRWTDWYARALWRQMGAPPSIPTIEALTQLVTHIADEQVEFQIQYNEASAHRLHQLDHRLHQIGNGLFYATIAVGLGALAGLLLGSPWVHDHAQLMTVASASLPTLGAALFGIRGQADFIGAAGRCDETAQKLRTVAAHLRAGQGDLMLSCRAAENVAATMLNDLTDWRTAYRHRKLAIPA